MEENLIYGVLKDIIKTVGDDEDDWTPDYKEGWGVFDYMFDATDKSGLFGIFQPIADASKDIQFGGTGLGGFIGPALDYKTFTQLPIPMNYLLKE